MDLSGWPFNPVNRGGLNLFSLLLTGRSLIAWSGLARTGWLWGDVRLGGKPSFCWASIRSWAKYRAQLFTVYLPPGRFPTGGMPFSSPYLIFSWLTEGKFLIIISMIQ
jgi:hypothetical protein